MARGRTDSIFRYLGQLLVQQKPIPHSPRGRSASRPSRVVSGPLPPRATRRLSAHAAALRSTTVGS